jgi:putative phage-type endonuclease
MDLNELLALSRNSAWKPQPSSAPPPAAEKEHLPAFCDGAKCDGAKWPQWSFVHSPVTPKYRNPYHMRDEVRAAKEAEAAGAAAGGGGAQAGAEAAGAAAGGGGARAGAEAAGAETAAAPMFPVRGLDEPELTEDAYFARFVARTPDECAAESRHTQQTPKWYQSKLLTYGASSAADVCGRGYRKTTALEATEDRFRRYSELFGTPPKDTQDTSPMDWGNENEDTARKWFEAVSGLRVDEYGVLKLPAHPWLAVSPDGVIPLPPAADGTPRNRLLEIKCPYYLWRSNGRHPYAKHPQNVPPYYYDQVQCTMGVMHMHDVLYPAQPAWNVVDCDFVVWQPGTLWVTRVPFDQTYFEDKIFGPLRDTFTRLYLPRLVLYFNRRWDQVTFAED